MAKCVNGCVFVVCVIYVFFIPIPPTPLSIPHHSERAYKWSWPPHWREKCDPPSSWRLAPLLGKTQRSVRVLRSVWSRPVVCGGETKGEMSLYNGDIGCRSETITLYNGDTDDERCGNGKVR